MTIRYHIGEKDTRPWGDWEVLDVGAAHIVKRIRVLPHRLLSLQLHHHRAEHWIITEGTATVYVGGNVLTAPANTAVYIPVKTKHRVENKSDAPVVLIEIQTGETLDENDIVRFEDSYGRAPAA